MTDEELLQEYAQEESEPAFRELVERHWPWVRAAAMRQVRREDVADDVAQAVFIVLSEKAHKLRRPIVLSAWLFKVLRYAALDVLRQERRRRDRERSAAWDAEEVVDAVGQPDDTQRLSPLLDELVARLSEKDRRATLLRFYEQMSFVEVGDALGVSEEAARKRVNRAVERLRGLFRRHGITVDQAALAMIPMGDDKPPIPWQFGAQQAGGRAGAIAQGVHNMFRAVQIKRTLLAAVMIVGGVVSTVLAVQSLRGPESAALAPASQGSSPFQARLPSGVTVEFLGVLPPRSNATETWYSPDGRQEIRIPFRQPIVYMGGPNTISTYFAFEVGNLPPAAVGNGRQPSDVNTWMQIIPHRSTTLYPWVERIGGQRRMFLVLQTSPNRPLTSIRLYLASGAWQDAGQFKPSEFGHIVEIHSSDPRMRSSVIFKGVTTSEGQATAEFEDPLPNRLYVLRLTAVDRAGKEHIASSPNAAVIDERDKQRKMSFFFDTPADQLVALNVSYRPHEVIEVTNIVMKPGEGEVPPRMIAAPTTGPTH